MTYFVDSEVACNTLVGPADCCLDTSSAGHGLAESPDASSFEQVVEDSSMHSGLVGQVEQDKPGLVRATETSLVLAGREHS